MAIIDFNLESNNKIESAINAVRTFSDREVAERFFIGTVMDKDNARLTIGLRGVASVNINFLDLIDVWVERR